MRRRVNGHALTVMQPPVLQNFITAMCNEEKNCYRGKEVGSSMFADPEVPGQPQAAALSQVLKQDTPLFSWGIGPRKPVKA